ncbi:hypothetical protein A3860_24515 [Niastella vici]|uniref:Lipid-binding hydrolase n=1 Tax=Niastella vici TaxID=1703345 RepID=A0A1V9FYW6_9BACT|nr:lipid-binding protein [Niastella vici]OQP63507.1 hypothetical protein A3860_24515 [Niastella vici]
MINKIVMRHIKIIILFFGAACMWACSKDLPDAGGTSAKEFANEWWVKINDTGKVVKLSTYNTSLNPDSMWVDDLKHLGSFKCKAKIDVSALTFSVQNSSNTYSAVTVNITNGKILKNAGVSKTGNVVDSIYMEVEFSNKPGIKNKIAGSARTRWDEDDY